MYLMIHAKTFLTTYRLGSVTAAAAQLSVTQPAASGHLKALEASLQKKLFIKSGRGLVPTAAGHALAQSLAPYIDGLDHTLTVARMSSDQLVGDVSLGGPVEFLSRVLLPCISQITESRLRLTVQFGLAEALAEQLRSAELDLAVLTVKPNASSLDTVALYREEFTLVCAPRVAARLPVARGEALDSTELENLPWVAYDEGLPLIRRFWRGAFGRVPTIKARAVVPDLHALRAMAIAGAGLTVLPRYLVEKDLADGELVELAKAASMPGNTLYLSWAKGSLRSPKILFVKDIIVAAAAAL
jgi:DNA-binding transcriptional LysR family regulator